MIFLGTIANLGSDVINNSTTAAPFVIPTWVDIVRVQPSAATQMAATKLATDATFLPAATDMLQLGTAQSVQDIPLPRDGGGPVTLAIRKTDAGAATCKVFGIGHL